MGWSIAERRPLLLLTLLCLLLFLPGLFSLPPVDRDEARFAQASKQMLETGDLVDIRFQDVPRHRKPVGIYWLQAASAKLLSAPPYDEIWAYRIPSLLGALGAVLLTFWAGRPLFGAQAAFLGAALLAGTIMLGAEARLAKTDAALLACIVLAQGVLVRAYLARSLRLGHALLFWAALGAGILIKGPIILLVSGLTLLALAIADRGLDWAKALRPLPGLPLLLLIVLPWLTAIWLATDGRFFAEAIGGDMASKLAGGQESHGAPPGYYLVASILAFWPATLFLLPALSHAIRERRLPAYRFALAWALPVWLAFELVPTKLPHYVLPAYPALALLCGAAIFAGARMVQSLWGKLALAGFAGAAIGFAALLGGVQRVSDGVYHLGDMTLAALALIFAALAAFAFWQWRNVRAAALALASSFVVTSGTLGLIAPGLDTPWISPRLVAALPRMEDGKLPHLIVSGYSEPSLVFLAGMDTQLLPPQAAAEALSRQPGSIAAISTEADAAFQAKLLKQGTRVEAAGRVGGFNYSTGKPVTLILYKAGS